jgi:hypothetical protein
VRGRAECLDLRAERRVTHSVGQGLAAVGEAETVAQPLDLLGCGLPATAGGELLGYGSKLVDDVWRRVDEQGDSGRAASAVELCAEERSLVGRSGRWRARGGVWLLTAPGVSLLESAVAPGPSFVGAFVAIDVCDAGFKLGDGHALDLSVGEGVGGADLGGAARQGCDGAIDWLTRVVGAEGIVELGVAADEVEAVGVPSAAEGDVAPFAVEGVRPEDESLVDGGALGFVAGDGVGVVEGGTAALGGALQVAGGKRDLITRRSRVRIPPPLLIKVLVIQAKEEPRRSGALVFSGPRQTVVKRTGADHRSSRRPGRQLRPASRG